VGHGVADVKGERGQQRRVRENARARVAMGRGTGAPLGPKHPSARSTPRPGRVGEGRGKGGACARMGRCGASYRVSGVKLV
jgi:hypothetical protein